MPPPANPTSFFNILRRSCNPNVSGTLSGVATVYRGTALGAGSGPLNPLDFQQFVLAGPTTGFIGFSTRDWTVTGPALADMIFGTQTGQGAAAGGPAGVEFPFKLGESGAAEKADAFEVEGPGGAGAGLYSGVAAAMITGATPLGTPLTFVNGQLAVSAGVSGVQSSYYFLSANNLAPYIAGNLRVRAEIL